MPKQIKAFMMDGDGIKDIPFSGVTTSDLDRWFGGDGKKTDPEVLAGRVGTLFRCIELRCQAIADMPRVLLDEAENELDEEELPFSIDLHDLLWRTELAQIIKAAAYWHKEKNRVRLTGVRWLDPRTIQPNVTSKDGLVDFTRVINGRPLAEPIPKDDMVWFWRPGLGEVGTGQAPGQVAARAAAIVDNVYKFLEALFESGAIGTTVVFAESRPGTTERGKLKAYLERVLTGIGNAFGIEVLSEALRFERLTPPLKDMQIPNLEDKKQQDICVTLGVPFSLLFSGHANYAASSEKDDVHFYTKTIAPEHRFLVKQANKRLFMALGLRLVSRPDKLELFQQIESGKVLEASMLFDRGAITEDEYREAGGYQPRKPQDNKPAEDVSRLDEVAEDAGAAAKRQAKDEYSSGRTADLGRWERKVVKAVKGGGIAAEVKFESDFISSWERAALRTGLLNARTPEEVKAAFAAPFRTKETHRVQDLPG